MLTLYDAARCPYCARVRILLAEKGVEHEVVAIDLSDRPAWLYQKNPAGKVPVLEEDGWASSARSRSASASSSRSCPSPRRAA